MTGSFNIYDDPWVAVVDGEGAHRELSLRDTLAQAGSIRALDGELGTQDTAVTRLILAFLYRALDITDIRAWKNVWNAHSFPMNLIDGYVNGPLPDGAWNDGTVTNVHDRLWLDDPKLPFLQVAGLGPVVKKGETVDDMAKPLSYIMSDVRTHEAGQHVETFNSGRRASDYASITMGEAARWLPSVLTYDVGGIHTGMAGDSNSAKGKTVPEISNAARSTVPIIDGGNLFSTLVFAMVPAGMEGTPRGIEPPLWERAPQTPESKAKGDTTSIESITTAYLFPMRRIRYRIEDGEDGRMVTGVFIGGGERMQEFRTGCDPMLATKSITDGKTGEVTIRPWKAGRGQALWQGLPALLARSGQRKEGAGVAFTPPPTVSFIRDLDIPEASGDDGLIMNVTAVTVFYDGKNATVQDISDDHLRLPAAVIHDQWLSDAAVEAVEKAQSMARPWNAFCEELRSAAGSITKRGYDDHKDWMDEYWSAVEDGFGTWVRTLGPESDIEERMGAWYAELFSIIVRLKDTIIEDMPPSVFAGRVGDDKRMHSYGFAADRLAYAMREQGIHPRMRNNNEGKDRN